VKVTLCEPYHFSISLICGFAFGHIVQERVFMYTSHLALNIRVFVIFLLVLRRIQYSLRDHLKKSLVEILVNFVVIKKKYFSTQ